MILTNNPLLRQAFPTARCLCCEEERGFLQVLEWARDFIHQGHVLLTHPLSGSVKPGQTPYKTILLSQKPGELNQTSLSIIEESIALARSQLDKRPLSPLPEKVDRDFQLIDFCLIEDCIREHEAL